MYEKSIYTVHECWTTDSRTPHDEMTSEIVSGMAG